MEAYKFLQSRKDKLNSFFVANKNIFGKSIRVSVRKKRSIYKDFNLTMRDNENKTDPFEMIASSFTLSSSLNQTNIAANQGNALRNEQELLDEIQPSNHEEADYRLLLALRKRFRQLSIITVDMEVVETALYFFSLYFNELQVEFGAGQHRKYIPIHEITRCLGEEFC